MDKASLSKAGTIIKTHGIHGELVMKMTAGHGLTIRKGDPLFILIDGGLVPFFVLSFEESGSRSALIHLENVETEEKAGRLKGADVYLDQPSTGSEPSNSELPVSGLEGYELVDEVSGKRGMVVDVIDVPGNPLLRIHMGDKELLVPLHREFIKKWNQEEKQLVVRIPGDLAELY